MASRALVPTEQEPIRQLEPADEQPQGMTDDELAALLSAHETSAVGYFTDNIAAAQARAIDYYYGKMDDLPVVEGCSAVVDHVVAVMVDNGLAAVLKPFVSSNEVVVFEPHGPEDVEQAEQATDYVNYVIQCDNPGFIIFHDWFKDAFLTKLGVVKTWWEDTSSYGVEKRPVDAEGLLQARGHPDYLDEEEHPDQPGVYLAHMQKADPDGRIRVANVPPEEFLISPLARSIEDSPYCAHRPSDFTRSDAIEMGIDPEIVEDLPSDEATQLGEARQQARYRDEQAIAGSKLGISSDRSQDVLALLDEYVRVDYDGDGISELRRVVRVGDVILLNEVVAENPFAGICPVPMPHKVYGQSVADQSMEGQKVLTVITRQTLDNLYKSNNPRPIVPESAIGKATWEDLLDASPGAAIRTKGELGWLQVPFAADKSFGMMENMWQGVEERTGIQRKGLGMNPEVLKKNSPDTATQATIAEGSRNERAEMIARIFAETGVKRLFSLILKLLVAHQPKARMIRLRNKFVEMDPSGWNPEMDLSISVGLGVGNRGEQIAQANNVLETMWNLDQTQYAELIDAGNVRNALKKMLIATGIKNVDDYLQPPPPQQMGPDGQPLPKQPKPDPEAQKAQAEMQADQQKAQMQAQLETQRVQSQASTEAQRMQMQGQIEQMKLAQKAQADQAKAALEQQKAITEAQLAQQRSDFEQRLALAETRAQVELEREKLAMQREHGLGKLAVAHEATIEKNRPGGKLDE